MAALLRDTLGEVLRAERIERGMTLRQVSTAARVSLGYLSEIERGQKEASSELLAAVCEAMQLPLSHALIRSAQKVAATEVSVLTPVGAAA